MVFSSTVFLFFFLPITLLMYYITPSKGKNCILLFANILFYGWGEPVYLFLMLASTGADYLFGLFVRKYRFLLPCSIVKIGRAHV